MILVKDLSNLQDQTNLTKLITNEPLEIFFKLENKALTNTLRS